METTILEAYLITGLGLSAVITFSVVTFFQTIGMNEDNLDREQQRVVIQARFVCAILAIACFVKLIITANNINALVHG